jgi:hypothetical protein
MLLRYHSELKVCFKHYSSLDVGLAESESKFTMNMEQLRRMMKDCMVLESGLQWADVCDLMMGMRRHHQLHIVSGWETADHKLNERSNVYYDEGKEKKGVYASDRVILFREFIEGLVRIAHFKFCISSAGTTLRDAVKSLVEDYVRTHAMQEVDDKIGDRKVVALVKSEAPIVGKLFKSYCVGGSDTLSARGLEAFYRDVKSIIGDEKKKKLTAAEIKAFTGMRGSAGGRLTSIEFGEALLRVATELGGSKPLVEKFRAFVSDVLKPLVKTLDQEEGGKELWTMEGQASVKASGVRVLQVPPRRMA